MMCKDQSSGVRELKTAEYRSKHKDIKSINKELRQRIRDRETRFGQLISFSIISQVGILLITIISSATLRRYRWMPFSLLSLDSILFWLPITATVSELLRIQYEYDVSFMKQLIIFQRLHVAENELADGSSGECSSSQNKRRFLKPDKGTLYRRYAYMSVIISVLFAFTVVVFSACHAILRDGDRTI